MFGWLAHALTSIRPSASTANGAISRCTVAMSGTELAARLPLLGSVLYLPARRATQEPSLITPRWLVARRELAPLLRTRDLLASSMIGGDGPREWIDCIDAHGRYCARLHLLPDTDYLAWDALLVRARSLPAAPLCLDHLVCRAASAELVCFRVRPLGALDVLDTLPVGRLSALGRGIAREVARAAAVELEPALG